MYVVARRFRMAESVRHHSGGGGGLGPPHSQQHGFVALQDQPMESSLSRCRRRTSNTASYTDVPAMPTDLTYTRKPHDSQLQPAVQQSSSWPSRVAAEQGPISRVPPGISRPPFSGGSVHDKNLLPCRYMKERGVDTPLHHLPPAAMPIDGSRLVGPMWGASGAPFYPAGYQEAPVAAAMMQPEPGVAPVAEPPRYDLLQDAMRQTINGSGYVPPNPRLMSQALPPLQHTVHIPYQAEGTWVQQKKDMPNTQQVPLIVPDYSHSNLSANDSFDAGASDGDYDDGGGDDARLDLPPTENPEDLVIEIDLSHKPETLQEAIAMYIDFLVLENDKKTHISECQLLPVRFDFEKEQYYMEVMSKPTPFPTEKFRGWLKLYNVDIEITDPQGNTASQTTFAPTVQNNDTDGPPIRPVPRLPPPALQHLPNWQVMNPEIPLMPAAKMATNEMPAMAGAETCPPLAPSMPPDSTLHQQMEAPLTEMPPGVMRNNVRVSVGIQCNDTGEQHVGPATVNSTTPAAAYTSSPAPHSYQPVDNGQMQEAYMQHSSSQYPESAANAIFSAVCGLENSSLAPNVLTPVVNASCSEATDRSRQASSDCSAQYTELMPARGSGESNLSYVVTASIKEDCYDEKQNVICIAPIADVDPNTGVAAQAVQATISTAAAAEPADGNMKRPNSELDTAEFAKRSCIAQPFSLPPVSP